MFPPARWATPQIESPHKMPRPRSTRRSRTKTSPNSTSKTIAYAMNSPFPFATARIVNATKYAPLKM